jgi:hypothetical protein
MGKFKPRRARTNPRYSVQVGASKAGAAPVESTAEDLRPSDRRWAESLSMVAGCTLNEAEKRVRRIRHDQKIEVQLHDIARQLGPRVVITNIEWSGPTMTDLTVSVCPAPVEAYPVLASGAPAIAGVRNPLQEMANLRAQAQARSAMRADVSKFELTRSFPRSRLALNALSVEEML